MEALACSCATFRFNYTSVALMAKIPQPSISPNGKFPWDVRLQVTFPVIAIYLGDLMGGFARNVRRRFDS